MLARLDAFNASSRGTGEPQANFVMGEIAKRLTAALRRYDFLGRYSPRHFLILIPGWEPSQATSLAEKLRKAVAEPPFDISGLQARVTISLVPANSEDFRSRGQAEVLHQLEASLNSTEENGGNRVASLSSIVESRPRLLSRQRRLRVSWVIGGVMAAAIGAGLLFSPSWTCAPNLLGDILDSSELPPPLPANCVLTTERATESTIQSLESLREAAGLELQGTVTCKIPSSSTARSSKAQEQWLGNLYADGKLQYRRHVLLTASQNVPGGKLFIVEQCLTPWWRYIRQSQEYCRVEPPWR